MSLLVAPAGGVPDTPAVGIFWMVKDALIAEGTALAEAEPYGSCLTHAMGHYDRWERWQAMDEATFRRLHLPAAVRFSEYDDWPRGRVVYETDHNCFVIYADKRFWRRTGALQVVRQTFRLGANALVRRDAHYDEGW